MTQMAFHMGESKLSQSCTRHQSLGREHNTFIMVYIRAEMQKEGDAGDAICANFLGLHSIFWNFLTVFVQFCCFSCKIFKKLSANPKN